MQAEDAGLHIESQRRLPVTMLVPSTMIDKALHFKFGTFIRRSSWLLLRLHSRTSWAEHVATISPHPLKKNKTQTRFTGCSRGTRSIFRSRKKYCLKDLNISTLTSEHGPKCLGQLSPPHEYSKVKRRRRGDKRQRHTMPCLLKSGGRKNRPLPYDLWRLWDYLYLFYHIINYKFNRSLCNYTVAHKECTLNVFTIPIPGRVQAW